MQGEPITNLLGKRFALRNLLKNKKYHNYDGSIERNELTPEKEPGLVDLLKGFAKAIVENPDLLLKESYDFNERQRDWISLVKKEVLQGQEVLELDARSKPGHKILDSYMTHFWNVTNHKGVSVRNCMTQEQLEKALFQNIMMHSTPYPSEIRRMLIMTSGLSNVTKYRTVTAKAIVQHFGAKRVFDPCVGWGGRMLGTLSAGEDTYYTGCEPDTNTSDALMQILNDTAIPSEATDRAVIWNEPVEKVLPLLTETFDMILTSPPYFNLELYTTGEQSTVQYKTWDEWRTKWLKPVILGCLLLLKEDGVSCWSVKNFRSDKQYPLADEVKKIHEDAKWKLVKTVKMTGSGRPGSHRIRDGSETRGSEEETFCFRRC